MGLVICWLLNTSHLGIAALLLFVVGESTLPTVFVLAAGIGLLQIAYVVPIWRLLKQRGKGRTARGVIIAACLTLLLNAIALAFPILRFHL